MARGFSNLRRSPRAAQMANLGLGIGRTPGVNITMKMTKFFLDREGVINRVGKARINTLRKIGAYIRSDARRSIRNRRDRQKFISDPGQPPYSHDYPQHRLKMIFFVYDHTRDSMVVGPVFLARRQGTTVPGLHEHGGQRVVNIRVQGQPGRKATPKQRQALLKKIGRVHLRRRNETVTGKSIRYPRRPFMEPAYEKNRPLIPRILRDKLNDQFRRSISPGRPFTLRG